MRCWLRPISRGSVMTGTVPWYSSSVSARTRTLSEAPISRDGTE